MINKIIIDTTGLEQWRRLALILDEIVTYCGIDKTKYHMLGSYALREYVPIGDLDINMLSEEWDKLDAHDIGRREMYNGQMRMFIAFPEISDSAEIEIFRKESHEGYPINRFSADNIAVEWGFDVDVYGHQCYKLETLIEWKIISRRDKDLRHLLILLLSDKTPRHLIPVLTNTTSSW